MSKRVSNKVQRARNGKLHGRQRVRLGWRKRRLRDLLFLTRAQAQYEQLVNAAGEVS